MFTKKQWMLALLMATVAAAWAILIARWLTPEPSMRGGFLGGGAVIGTGGGGGASITPNTCTNGQVLGAIAGNGTSTCVTQNDNNYGGTHFEWVDDWLMNSCSLGTNGTCGSAYNAVFAGTGATVLSTGTTGRPGILQLQVGTTTTGAAGFQTSPTAIDFGSGSWTFEIVIGAEALSNVTDEYSLIAGFGDTAGVNQVDGCYFLYDRGNVATSGPNTGNADVWECWCAANSARTTFRMNGSDVSNESFTTVNQPVAAVSLPNTNIFHLKLVMTGTTRAEFFVNGTKSCDINTNIPSGASRLTGVQVRATKSAGTTSRNVDIDWSRLAVDLTGARSP